jgi:hypothetical protein
MSEKGNYIPLSYPSRNKANEAVANYLLAETEEDRYRWFDAMRGIGWKATWGLFIRESNLSNYTAKRRLIEDLVLDFVAQWQDVCTPTEIRQLAAIGEFRHLGRYIRNKFIDHIRSKYRLKNEGGTAQFSTDFPLAGNATAGDLIPWDVGKAGHSVLAVPSKELPTEPRYEVQELLSFVEEGKDELLSILGKGPYEALLTAVDLFPLMPEVGRMKRERKSLFTESVSRGRGVSVQQARADIRTLRAKLNDAIRSGNVRVSRLFRMLLPSRPVRPSIPWRKKALKASLVRMPGDEDEPTFVSDADSE